MRPVKLILWLTFTVSILFVIMGFTLNGNNTVKVVYGEEDELLYPVKETNDVSYYGFLPVYADSGEVADSTVIDSLSLEDTAEVELTPYDSLLLDSLAIDSTARLKYFKYQRKDNITTRFSEKKGSAFFLKPGQSYYKRDTKIDSTGKYVIIEEEIGGVKLKTPLKIPIDQYVKMRMKEKNRKLWEQLGYDYELKAANADISELMTDITNIEIPLPPSGIFSIFGPPQINLRISGAVDIHGAWKSETTDGYTASTLGNTRNEPDFKQQVQINVDGTIGDKLTITADWNTERTFEYENQLYIKYTGYEDEIIQSIEAGNVSLQTSSLVGGSEALFGIKARMQFGAFSLTALASQKKGEVEEVSLTGGSSTSTFEIRAYNYSENHFFIDDDYSDSDFFNQYFSDPTHTIPDYSYRIDEIEVWKNLQNQGNNQSARYVTAFLNLDSLLQTQSYDELREITEGVPGRINTGRFIKLTEDVDYIIHPETGFITLTSTPTKDDIIAVAYRRAGINPSDPEDDIKIGEFLADATSDQRLVLNLVKPDNLDPTYPDAWKLKLKNIYPTGGRDLSQEDFKAYIYREQAGSEDLDGVGDKKFLELFGLDKYSASGGSSSPDGEFDFASGTTIIPRTGEIIFPVLQPFGRDLPDALDPDDYGYEELYSESITNAKKQTTKDKWIISGEFSASVQSTFNIGFNVVENSVKATLNGAELTPGVDYTVDYNIGIITIRNDAALTPGADLKVTYEKNDLFQLASKTLVGFRGLYEFDKQNQLGFSFLSLNQQTLSDKVRIGEEPLQNTIMGLDFKTQFDLPFITKALDNVISTKAPSSLTFSGELAYINPDPNTKKSTISSDNGKSVAYVDDFEGAKRLIPISINFSTWKDISAPLTDDNVTELSHDFKGRAYWYTDNQGENVRNIWGNRREVSNNNENIQILDFYFDPTLKGQYNTDRFNTNFVASPQNWGGMMKALSSTASNLDEENIDFIEFWVNMNGAPANSKLNIDLGAISEDVYPDGQLSTEDVDENLTYTDPSEDTGLDGVMNSEEEGYDAATNPDPAGDDFQRGNLPYINNTQDNREFVEGGREPDTEDLNRNYTLDKTNAYYRYVIPMDTSRTSNPFVSGQGENGWVQIRIPLKDYTYKSEALEGFTNITTIRLWATGITERMHLRLVEFNLVGNQWLKIEDENRVTKDDSVLVVSTINYEDNPNEYTLPAGLERERDRSSTDTDVLKNEQSLRLTFNDLPDGDYREIVKYSREMDVFNYKEMKLFIHGDLDSNTTSSVSYYENVNDHGTEVYLRFGSDTNNYYEYRQPTRGDWNEIDIVFSELTALKQTRVNTDSLYQIAVDPANKPGHYYGIKGNPSLTKVKFFLFGVKNPKDKGEFGIPVSGQIWLNELRVLDAENTPGMAYKAASTIKLADLMNVSVNISDTDPYFHRISEQFGSRQDSRSWSVNTDFNLLKLIPANLQGSNLRVNYSHTESYNKPQYLPGTDVDIENAKIQTRKQLIEEGYSPEQATKIADDLQVNSQTINVSDSWSLNGVKIKVPSDSWYIKHTVNSLTLGFNMNTKYSRSPTIKLNRSWVWNANLNYDLKFSNENYFYPANIPIIGNLFSIVGDYRNVKFYFTPQTFNSGISARRNWSYRLSRSNNNSSSGSVTLPSITRNFTVDRNFAFNWKFTEGGFLNLTTSYQASFQSTLDHLLTIQINDQLVDRDENEIWNDIFGGAFPGIDTDFKQSLDFRTSPKLPSWFDMNKFVSLSMGYNVGFTWKNDLNKGDAGRSASYSNSIRGSFDLRLKSLMSPLFGEDESTGRLKTPRRNNRNAQRGRDRGRQTQNNQTNDNDDDNDEEIPDSLDTRPSTIVRALNFMKSGAFYLFFDYDKINVTYNQSNQYGGAGLDAIGTGFKNFWGLTHNPNEGPSRSFMFGISNDLGKRVEGVTLRDQQSQRNSLSFKTSKPLWEGASIDFDWSVGWSMNKSIEMDIDENTGNLMISNTTATGTLERSFLSLPKVFFLPMVDNGIVKVNENYDPNAEDASANLSSAFVEGMESMPFLANIPILSDFSKYIPRANWTFNWRGLEKIGFLKNFTKNVSLTHKYSSKYTEGWKITPEGKEAIQTQKINYAFSPLVGVNITFKEIWGGDFSGSIKLNQSKSYDLGNSTRNITETTSDDIGFTATYAKRGFSLPLFGFSLKNDLQFSLSYSTGTNKSVIFDMDDFTEEGKPQDGTVRTTLEPKVQYTISQRVTLSIYYKQTSVEPEGASRIPPTTTNEAGLDLHITIQ